MHLDTLASKNASVAEAVRSQGLYCMSRDNPEINCKEEPNLFSEQCADAGLYPFLCDRCQNLMRKKAIPKPNVPDFETVTIAIQTEDH